MFEVDQIAAYFSKLDTDGDDALHELCEAYYEKLAVIARHRFGRYPRRVTDEYAVANAALQAFHERALRGDYAQVR